MLRLLVGATVSVTLSLPSRGTFHLSLTVLVRYRWQRVFSLRRWSSQIPARFLVSRGTWVLSSKPYTFRLPDFHRLWCDFPDTSTKCKVSDLLAERQSCTESPATPKKQRLPAITPLWFRLLRFRSPLLAQSQRHSKLCLYCFLFVRLLRCFSSPAALQLPYVFR